MSYAITPPSISSPPFSSHCLAPEVNAKRLVPCCSLCRKVVHTVKSSIRMDEESCASFNKRIHNGFNKRIQITDRACTLFSSFFHPFWKVNVLSIRHLSPLVRHGSPRHGGCATGYYQIILSWHKKFKSHFFSLSCTSSYGNGARNVFLIGCQSCTFLDTFRRKSSFLGSLEEDRSSILS